MCSGCLRSWLEQDPVCPTCRSSLSGLLRDSGPAEQAENQRRRGRRRYIRLLAYSSLSNFLTTSPFLSKETGCSSSMEPPLPVGYQRFHLNYTIRMVTQYIQTNQSLKEMQVLFWKHSRSFFSNSLSLSLLG